MFNQTFIDHWNHHDWTVESYINWLKVPHYRQDIDLLAVAPDGTFAGFCVCMIDPDDNRENNRSEGWIDILGTRRGFRKIGLGRALLLEGMKALKANGIEVAVLGVDAENPTGALGLYESVGFRPVIKTATYHKDL
jgi:ribosomal protein S18 acetylase RimI-like enzyme